MRLSVSGTGCIGKSTMVEDFLNRWTMYKRADFDYRTLIESKNLAHSKETNKETQWAILNGMVDEMQKWSEDDYVIMDRNPLDNIVYSIWAADKGISDIDDAFIEKCLPIVKESMKMLDIIFFIPITRAAPVQIVEDKLRETDKNYIEEIDNLFKVINFQYQRNLTPENPFFCHDDCPALIEIFGDRDQRMYLIRQYLDGEGNAITNCDTLENIMSDIEKNPEVKEKLEDIIQDQKIESFQQGKKIII